MLYQTISGYHELHTLIFLQPSQTPCIIIGIANFLQYYEQADAPHRRQLLAYWSLYTVTATNDDMLNV